MTNDIGFSICISDSEYGPDGETHIKNALSNEHILKWAYILHDINIHKMELQHNWDIVIVTDKDFSSEEVSKWFNVSSQYVVKRNKATTLVYALKDLLRENDMSRKLDCQQYSIDEVKSNFDLREYIDELSKKQKWELFKDCFDPAMIFSLALFTFIIFCAIKFANQNTGLNPWLIPGIIGGIGVFYLVVNLLARKKGEKEGRFISGIPFIGGIHLLIAGIIAPVKWLALLCLLDWSIWMFVSEFINIKKNK